MNDDYKKYTIQARRCVKGEAFFESLGKWRKDGRPEDNSEAKEIGMAEQPNGYRRQFLSQTNNKEEGVR